MATYGYCRVSTHSQRIERQETNIRERYPQAVIYKEAFTGTKLQGRKELDKILRRVNPGDTIVFDEVSRMSRNAETLYRQVLPPYRVQTVGRFFICHLKQETSKMGAYIHAFNGRLWNTE